jgi:glutamate carboxypeptidase
MGFLAPRTETRAGWDVALLCALGLPTLDGMGPLGRNNCTPEEYIEIDSMVLRSAVLAVTLARLAEEAA